MLRPSSAPRFRSVAPDPPRASPAEVRAASAGSRTQPSSRISCTGGSPSASRAGGRLAGAGPRPLPLPAPPAGVALLVRAPRAALPA
eukprot:10485033-Alexandrium_andersonii.AAC.1